MAVSDAIPLTFKEWLTDIGGMTEAGRSKLEKATVVNLAAVKLMTLDDILEIKLRVGDRAIFKAGWEALTAVNVLLRTPPPAVDSVDSVQSLQEVSTRAKTLNFIQLLKSVICWGSWALRV